jgi:hypothetical protein
MNELDQAEVRQVQAEWAVHADRGARLHRRSEEDRWKAAKEFREAHGAGASWRQIAERVELSHTYVRLLVKALETRIPGELFADAYRRVRSTADGDRPPLASRLAALREADALDEGDLESLAESLFGQREEKKTKPAVAIELGDREAERSTPGDLVREIRLLIPASKIEEFGKMVVDLQQLWGLHTLMEVIERAVSEAHSRRQASASGRVGSEAALPEELVVGRWPKEMEGEEEE